jgi:hypothetical protein
MASTGARSLHFEQTRCPCSPLLCRHAVKQQAQDPAGRLKGCVFRQLCKQQSKQQHTHLAYLCLCAGWCAPKLVKADVKPLVDGLHIPCGRHTVSGMMITT